MKPYKHLITELTGKERKPVDKWTKLLPRVFRECERALLDYKAGEKGGIPFLQDIGVALGVLTELRSALKKSHGLHYKD